jgi:hypothetical protein
LVEFHLKYRETQTHFLAHLGDNSYHVTTCP